MSTYYSPTDIKWAKKIAVFLTVPGGEGQNNLGPFLRCRYSLPANPNDTSENVLWRGERVQQLLQDIIGKILSPRKLQLQVQAHYLEDAVRLDAELAILGESNLSPVTLRRDLTGKLDDLFKALDTSAVGQATAVGHER